MDPTKTQSAVAKRPRSESPRMVAVLKKRSRTDSPRMSAEWKKTRRSMKEVSRQVYLMSKACRAFRSLLVESSCADSDVLEEDWYDDCCLCGSPPTSAAFDPQRPNLDASHEQQEIDFPVPTGPLNLDEEFETQEILELSQSQESDSTQHEEMAIQTALLLCFDKAGDAKDVQDDVLNVEVSAHTILKSIEQGECPQLPRASLDAAVWNAHMQAGLKMEADCAEAQASFCEAQARRQATFSTAIDQQLAGNNLSVNAPFE